MEDETGRACSKHGNMRNVYIILAGKSEIYFCEYLYFICEP
jgi:hypothetical protein